MWGGSYNPTLFNTHTSMFLSTATKHSTFTTQHPFEFMNICAYFVFECVDFCRILFKTENHRFIISYLYILAAHKFE